MKLIKNDKQQLGLTLIETVVVAALMFIIILPLMSLYIQSVTNMYVTDKISEAQKQGNNAIYFLSQDLGGATSFITTASNFCVFSTYQDVVAGYYLASDSTIRRVSSNSLTGGTVTARYVSNLSFNYYSDKTFTPTFSSNTVDAVRFDVLINIPASDLTNPNSVSTSGYFVSSYVWCRNRSTL